MDREIALVQRWPREPSETIRLSEDGISVRAIGWTLPDEKTMKAWRDSANARPKLSAVTARDEYRDHGKTQEWGELEVMVLIGNRMRAKIFAHCEALVEHAIFLAEQPNMSKRLQDFCRQYFDQDGSGATRALIEDMALRRATASAPSNTARKKGRL